MPRLANYKGGLKSLSNYNNVENFSKDQFGYLGEPLIVSDSILDAIIVHHMNTNNVNYTKSAPKIPDGAPMADFIYEDIMLRSEEVVQRYLCGEDEILLTRSQMSRMILKHLKKYHSLLKSTSKEAKLALNKERKRRMLFTNARSNLALSNVSDMIGLKKEIETKKRELLKMKIKGQNNRKLRIILEQLQRRKNEVQKELSKVAPEKKSRAANLLDELKNDIGQVNYSKLVTKTYNNLQSTTKVLVSPTYVVKGDKTNNKTVFNFAKVKNYSCASYPEITDKNTAHLVFASHPLNPNLSNSPITTTNSTFSSVSPQQKIFFLLQCEDTRINSTSASDFDDWKSDPRASRIVPFQGVMESFNRKQIPFRTVFGDRLVKRRLVLHSFIDRLNAALYINYTRNNTRSEFHPLYKRFSGLFLENMNSNVNTNARVDNGDLMNSNQEKKIKKKYGISLLTTGPKFAEIPSGSNLSSSQLRAMKKDLGVDTKGFTLQDTNKYAPITRFAGIDKKGYKANKNYNFYVPGTDGFRKNSDLQRASSRLFSLVKRGSNKGNVADTNTSTNDLLWNEKLRSFGTSGPQDYWIQLLREMYDSRRTENVRSKLRIMNSGKKRDVALKPEEVLTQFKDLNLGDNLGVTCYGYACNPRDPSAPWSTSYHRLGRSWFCADVNKDQFQLPFGCYSDRCAPPLVPVSHPNYHSSNGGTDPSRIKGDLELISVNNICTTVLQSVSKYGTQGRFGHIKTSYKGQRIGKMSPPEALSVFTTVRIANDNNDMPSTVPYKITMGLTDQLIEMNANQAQNKPTSVNDSNYRMVVVTGPELEISVLKARNAASITGVSENAFNGTYSPKIELNPTNVYNDFNNLSNNISTSKNSEIIYNTNKLKNNGSNRTKELKKHLQGVSNEWNALALGAKKVTGFDINPSKLKNMGAGLKRSSKDVKRDAETLDENFMIIDGDIFTGCNKDVNYLQYGGSERALGITKKFVTPPSPSGTTSFPVPVIPLILPLNPEHGSYQQIRRRSSIMFNSLLDDATSGVAGLVSRQMENVCVPIFKSGSLLKGTHFNDLMERFLSAVSTIEAKGESLEMRLKSPKLYNIMKCIQFYLYVHVGLSTQEALTEIAKYQARRNSKAIQDDMFALATKLRLLGNTGPMEKKMFQKIVRQYLLTSGNNNYKQPEEVKTEIEELSNKLTSFKVFGRRFARQSFLPSFLGGVQKANKKMGVPSSGLNRNLKGTGTSFENITGSLRKPVSTIKRLTKSSNGKEKMMIGSGGDDRIINKTNIRMSQVNKVKKNARKQGERAAGLVGNAMTQRRPTVINRISARGSFAPGFASQMS